MKKLILFIFMVGLMFGQGNPNNNQAPQVYTWGASAPQGVTNVSVSRTGAAGGTVYFYWVVANFTIGKSRVSPFAQISNAPNTLNGSNYVSIFWGSAAGALSYDILRTTTAFFPGNCTCAVATAQSGNTINDTGGALSSYTYNPVPNAVANIRLDNQSYSVPTLISDTTMVIPGISSIAVTTNTLKGDGLGSAIAVTGTGTDCVLVNGTSSPCLSGGVTSIAGTANQITASAATGAVTLSVPSTFTFPGTVTNNLGIFGATTSAQLRGVISDETGTGVLMFGTSPTITTSLLFDTGGGLYPTSATNVAMYPGATTGGFMAEILDTNSGTPCPGCSGLNQTSLTIYGRVDDTAGTTKYNNAVVRFSSYNPAATPTTKPVYEIGNEGRYTDGGVLTQYQFYIYDFVNSRTIGFTNYTAPTFWQWGGVADPINVVTYGTASGSTSGLLDYSASTGNNAFKAPAKAGCTVSFNSAMCYNTTTNMWHMGQSSADAMVPQFTVTPTNGQFATWVVSGSNYKLGATSSLFSGLTTNAMAVATSTTAIGTPCTGCTLTSAGQMTIKGAGTVGIDFAPNNAAKFAGAYSTSLGDVALYVDGGATFPQVFYGYGDNSAVEIANLTTTFIDMLATRTNFRGTLSTTGNCSSSASPAVCAAAPMGSVVIAAAATSVVVNTTAVTANSQIIIEYDSSLGTKLGVTCNTTINTDARVTARTAGTSFTITSTAPITNPACYSYAIIN